MFHYIIVMITNNILYTYTNTYSTSDNECKFTYFYKTSILMQTEVCFIKFFKLHELIT